MAIFVLQEPPLLLTQAAVMLRRITNSMIYRNNDLTKVLVLLLISITLASCGAGKRATSRGSEYSSSLQDDIIKYGKKYLGKPYRYAGRGPNSFDCSGYTSFVFKRFGYRLDSSSAGQDRQLPTIKRKEELRKGDLVFFEGRRKNGRVGHVGIVTEVYPNGRFRFIHASTSNGVIITSSTEPYYASRYLRGGRVLEDNASYVTRQSPPKKQTAYYTASTETEDAVQQILPASIGMTNSGKANPTTESDDNQKILVQTDPQKNRPLTAQQMPISNKAKDTISQAKKTTAVREEEIIVMVDPGKIHIVQMGETLYSISKKYGCSIEQLKALNPNLGDVLKAGQELQVPF